MESSTLVSGPVGITIFGVGTGISMAPVDVPSVIIYGAADGCMSADLLEGMEALFPRGLRKVVLPEAGHFVHREKPDEVNRILIEAFAD